MDTNKITRDEAAALAGVRPDTFSAYVARGQAPAPAAHIARTPLWDRDAVMTWLASRRGQGWRRGSELLAAIVLLFLLSACSGAPDSTSEPRASHPATTTAATASEPEHSDTTAQPLGTDVPITVPGGQTEAALQVAFDPATGHYGVQLTADLRGTSESMTFAVADFTGRSADGSVVAVADSAWPANPTLSAAACCVVGGWLMFASPITSIVYEREGQTLTWDVG